MKKDMMIYVKDIIDSIILIENNIKNITYADFKGNITLQDAVMRRFEIIGEAAARLTDEFRNKSTKIPWKAMIGLRNIIIHDYSSVNLKEIWRIAKIDLQKTKKEIERLMESS